MPAQAAPYKGKYGNNFKQQNINKEVFL